MSGYIIVKPNLRRWKPAIKLADAPTYDAALAGYAAVATTDTNRLMICVRSADDPKYAKVEHPPYGTPEFDEARTASRAIAAFIRKEIGKTATCVITHAAAENLSYNTIIRETNASLVKRGYDVQLFQVEQAVKNRVTIGRCRGYSMSKGCGRAYWFPKREGPLYGKTCPHCGKYLNQTTLALQAQFRRLTYNATPVAA